MDVKVLIEALEGLEEKGITKDVVFDAMEEALLNACKQHYGAKENFTVFIDRDKIECRIIQSREVVEEVDNPVSQISLQDAQLIDKVFKVGDTVNTEIDTKDFSRIAATIAKGTITQKLREVEKQNIYNEFSELNKTVVTGIVQRFSNRNICIDLGKVDAFLSEKEQVKGEHYRQSDRIKVFIVKVDNNNKGVKVSVSRTHPDLVKGLFSEEVSEIKDGIVEIKNVAREPGSRTKISVYSADENVDPVGACVGVNGTRVNAIVDELNGEKIDIINWSENPAQLIENALSPAKVIGVIADEDEKTAQVIVPDYQLSLAIGKSGQNARLAARLTNYKIDIKSETQARESGEFDEYFGEDDYYYDDEYYGDDEGYYEEDYDEEYLEDADDSIYNEETESEEYDDTSEEVSPIEEDSSEDEGTKDDE
ncbi:MAG: transcription termination factor NusA [Lachnospiraceae bacterium]|nr:transcription termination factor NusA [Lachnospiraceae bacterium]